MAKWNDNKTKIIYDNYDEFISVQSGRMKKFRKFNHKKEKHIIFDLKRFYKFVSKDAMILDIGCRDGWAMGRMKHNGYLNSIGMDVVPENVAMCKKSGYKAVVANCENMNMFEDNQFDAIFFRHTLEHCINREKALEECRRVLKPNEVLHIIVPIQKSGDKLKYGHSSVFTNSDELYDMISHWKYKVLMEKREEKTLSGIASTYLLCVA